MTGGPGSAASDDHEPQEGIAAYLAGGERMDTGFARVAAIGGGLVIALLGLIGILLTGFTATGSASQLRQGITFGGPATPTPRALSAANVAELVRINATSLGLPPTFVSAASLGGTDDTLVIGFDRALTDEERLKISGIAANALATNVTPFTNFAIAEAGTATQVSNDDLQLWNSRRIAPDEFLAKFQPANLPQSLLAVPVPTAVPGAVVVPTPEAETGLAAILPDLPNLLGGATADGTAPDVSLDGADLAVSYDEPLTGDGLLATLRGLGARIGGFGAGALGVVRVSTPDGDFELTDEQLADWEAGNVSDADLLGGLGIAGLGSGLVLSGLLPDLPNLLGGATADGTAPDVSLDGADLAVSYDEPLTGDGLLATLRGLGGRIGGFGEGLFGRLKVSTPDGDFELTDEQLADWEAGNISDADLLGGLGIAGLAGGGAALSGLLPELPNVFGRGITGRNVPEVTAEGSDLAVTYDAPLTGSGLLTVLRGLKNEVGDFADAPFETIRVSTPDGDFELTREQLAAWDSGQLSDTNLLGGLGVASLTLPTLEGIAPALPAIFDRNAEDGAEPAVTVDGENVTVALNEPTTGRGLLTTLQRLGTTVGSFADAPFENITISTPDGDVTIPRGKLVTWQAGGITDAELLQDTGPAAEALLATLTDATALTSDEAAEALVGGTTAAGETINLLMIVDASGSMAAELGNELRIEAARRALDNMINLLDEEQPAQVNVGFRIFGNGGNNTDAGRAESCQSTALLVPIEGGLDIPLLREQSATWQPVGWTPLALALESALGDFPPASDNIRNLIIVVSDGEESCDGDPCAAAQALGDAGIQVSMIGVGLTPESAEVLRCVPNNGNGIYIDVQDGQTLEDVFTQAVVKLSQP
ncbi:MAG: VWA domain-containing protein [Chloroflexaceae bacterium]|nr:VWA domain-containing protein [Chloroflexaceae bacterium]